MFCHLFQLTSVDLFFTEIHEELEKAKNIKVKFGKIQKTGGVKPPIEAAPIKEEGDVDELTEVGTEYTGEGGLDSERDRTKTYILDEDGQGDGGKMADDGEEMVKEQKPLYAESTGTLTPDI